MDTKQQFINWLNALAATNNALYALSESGPIEGIEACGVKRYVHLWASDRKALLEHVTELGVEIVRSDYSDDSYEFTFEFNGASFMWLWSKKQYDEALQPYLNVLSAFAVKEEAQHDPV